MITVGISESDATIMQLARHYLAEHAPKIKMTAPKKEEHYDIIIEHSPLPCICTADIHLLNTDAVSLPHKTDSSCFITYGLNHFATVTASALSAASDGLSFQYCLQRSVLSLAGEEFECQEFPVLIPSFSADIHAALAFVTLLLIADVPPLSIARIII